MQVRKKQLLIAGKGHEISKNAKIYNISDKQIIKKIKIRKKT